VEIFLLRVDYVKRLCYFDILPLILPLIKTFLLLGKREFLWNIHILQVNKDINKPSYSFHLHFTRCILDIFLVSSSSSTLVFLIKKFPPFVYMHLKFRSIIHNIIHAKKLFHHPLLAISHQTLQKTPESKVL
jgi:hypothetical protein